MPTFKKKISPTILKKLIEQDLQIKVELEHKFHDKRRWKIDLAVWTPSCKIAIEIEGAVFTRGRHVDGVGFLKDIEKYNTLTLYGWRLLRYTHSHHQYHEIISDIKKMI